MNSQPLIVLKPSPEGTAAPRCGPVIVVKSMSLFKNCLVTTPCDGLSLPDLVAGIRGGLWKAEVERCRALYASGDSKGYKSAKARLPAVMLSARVKHRRKGTSIDERKAVHSGLLQIDLDAKEHPGMKPGEIISTLKSIPWIVAAFRSPSEDGVKAIARCPANFDQHAGGWHAAEAELVRRDLKLDPGTKDWSRLCYVSHDPEAWLREDPWETIVPAEPPPPERVASSNRTGTVRPEHAQKIALELAEKLGRPGYPVWLKIASAFFHGCGVELGIEIMKEFFPPDKEGEYEKLAASLPHFIPWETLRSFGVDPTDPTDLLADMPEVFDEIAAGQKDESATASAFPITRAGEMEGASEALDFVEGLLTEGGGSVVYGPSNCGKTFWVLDLAVAVTTGKRFRGNLNVDQGAVIYLALEGSHGARHRIEALMRSERLPRDAPLFLCFSQVSLLDRSHAATLAATVKLVVEKSGLPCRLVILDTFARAIAGGDENSGKDMSAAVKSMDTVRAATGAHVMLVHHCGKNEALGARGHSSLRAAVDTEIEITRPEGETISTVRVTKQRDLPFGDPMPFSLETVELGTNRRGKPITSCIVHHEDEAKASKPGRPGRKAKCTAEEMLRFLPAASVKEWKDRVKEECGLGESQFYDNKRKLEGMGKTHREGGSNRILPVFPADLPALDDEPDE